MKKCPKNFRPEYLKVLNTEAKRLGFLIYPQLLDTDLVYNIAKYITEVTRSSQELRSGEIQCGIASDTTRTYESVGAHTNLVRTLIQQYLVTMYGHKLPIGFALKHPIRCTRRRLTKKHLFSLLFLLDILATIHDFPENEYGDIADDGNRDEQLKIAREHQYLKKIKELCVTIYGKKVTNKVFELYNEFEDKSSPIGRAMYCADKVAAILYYINSDKNGNYAYVKPEDVKKSATNTQSVRFCEETPNGYRLSDLWKNDYSRTRHLIRYDEDLFFISIIIMMNIIVHGEQDG